MAHDRAKRFPKLIIQTPADIGPGTYDVADLPELPGHLGKFGGVSIDFTDSRFKSQVFEGPGPAEYDVSEDLLEQCPRKRTHPGTWRGPAGKERNQTTLMYKGNFWSRMTGRTELSPFLTPSPGDYELELKKTAAQIHDERVREFKRTTSRQLRYLDANFPAPNRYSVKGSFDRFFKVPCKCDRYAVEPPPFGCTEKRFGDHPKSDGPGPGAYDPQGRMKCVASIYPAPFGACAGRFQKITVDVSPAPTDYQSDVGNLAYESEKRYKHSYGRTAGPIHLDKIILLDDDDEDYGAADFKKSNEEKKCRVYHAAFKSRTKRFSKPDKVDIPDPGAYETATAFKATRDRCEFLCRRSAPPFGTRDSRLPKTVVVQQPDPTTYKVATDIAENVKGGVMTFPRKARDAPRLPGPAYYCVRSYPWLPKRDSIY
ncbi:sperm-tail PG-rich repeat-containing protein 2 [Andrena cerasifolii]|uniref:sperm-tail PG-rich repeat-containing protein 2 n=1 Tax=Andrena cerasifolii TaxID=2819439 RepID=UPI004037ECB9